MFRPKSRMVASSWMFIWKPPSPATTQTGSAGEAEAGGAAVPRGLPPHAAAAPDPPARLGGVGEGHAHRRREREAHGAEAAARDVAVVLGELEELGRPHLVLADVGDESQVGACDLLYGLHDLDRAVLVARRLLAAPLRR